MRDFIGPLWVDGEPVLVREPAGKAWPVQRHKKRTALVVDDFGNAVCYVRRCAGCLRWLPLTFDYFAARGDGRVLGMQSTCQHCTTEQKRLRYKRDPERTRTVAREAERRRAQDPEYRRRVRERASRRRFERLADEQEAQRMRELWRASGRRYLERVMTDPQRYAGLLERNRINYRLRRERDGVGLDTVRSLPVRHPARDMKRRLFLPGAPLVVAVQRYMDSQSEWDGVTLAELGISERQWQRWKNEADYVVFDDADRALVRMGLLWFDVWKPGTEGFETVREAFEGKAAA